MTGQDDVIDAAKVAIQEAMAEGLDKHGPTKFRTESDTEHLLKACRHLLTERLITEGVTPDDGENHLHRALCRIAMCLVNRKSKPKWCKGVDTFVGVGTPCG